MARDYSEYSIPQLQEALANVDGRRYPENKSALEAELQERKDSGEFDQHLQNLEKARERVAKDKIDFARRMQEPIGAYLVINAICTLWFVTVSFDAANPILHSIFVLLFAVYMVVMLVGGIGVILKKKWAYWVAVGALAFQVVRIQSAAIAFSAGSVTYLYAYISSDVDVNFGFSFQLWGPEWTLMFGVTPSPPFYIGVNLIAVMMIVLLTRVRYAAEWES